MNKTRKKLYNKALMKMTAYEQALQKGELVKKKKVGFIQRYCRNRLAVFGFFLFVVLVLIAITVPLFFDYDKDVIKNVIKQRNLLPSAEHLFGTDNFGRDIFARVLWGSRISLFVGFVEVIVAMIIGSLIGATAAYYGGKIDDILMRIMDVFLAIPNTLLAICIVAALGLGIDKLIIAMTVTATPRFARIVRSAVLGVKGQEYVEAAKACGTKDFRIIVRHIIPNAMGPIIVQATTNVARSIITISSLSFVGLGVASPTPEWGSMLSEGKEFMRYFPHMVIFPGIAICLTALSLFAIGDGIRDALDPKLRN